MKTPLYIAVASVIAVAVLILVGGAVDNGATPSTPVTPAAPSRHEDLTTPHFVDATLDAGLLHMHLQGDEKLTGLNETLGAGACALDFNNDGWVDIFAVGGSGQTRFYGRQYWWQKAQRHSLFRNNKDGTFSDVTESAGLVASGWGMGCAAADLDNDGDTDLFITQFGKNILYRSNGDGTFTDVSTAAGLLQDVWSTSAVIADVDGDGLLDIYVVNYLRYVKGAKTFEAHSGFDLGMSPAFDAKLYDGVANHLLKNDGALRFHDIAAQAGVADSSGRGLSAAFFDANNDRYPDLYVANDAGFPNQLFLNNRDGTFSNATTEWKAGIAATTGGLAVGDVDRDGDSDVFLSSGAGELPKLLIQGSTPAWPRRDEAPNPLHYRDLARELGIADERFISHELWASAVADFNNDGRLDVLALSGLHTPDPTSYKVSQGQAKLWWLGKPDGGFIAANNGVVPLADRLSGRGVAVADFDNDGDLDAYVNNNNDLNQYLRNDSAISQSWIGFRVLSEHGGRDAYGAVVRVTDASGTQTNMIGGASGFLSQSDSRAHFGLAAGARAVSATVSWPNGVSATYDGLAPKYYYSIRAGSAPEAIASPEHKKESPRLRLAMGREDPANRAAYLALFRNATAALPDNEFIAALNDDNLAVRLAALSSLALPGNHITFRRLIAAVENSAPEVRLAALEGLRQVESEYSARWLLRLFDDPDPRVRAALAKTYSFFFREEEAMVHRKHLAVPYLIRLLDDSAQDVRLAAIHALGEAENFRGVTPLVALLRDRDVAVRREAARALGRIRERDAAPALIGAVESADQPPSVKAQAMIALKRLSEPRIDALFADLLRQPPQPDIGLQTLLAIRTDPIDGVVFNPGVLAEHALNATASLKLDKDTAVVLCQLLTGMRDARAQQTLKDLAAHPDNEVRVAAAAALDGAATRVNPTTGMASASVELHTRLKRELIPGAFLPTAPQAVTAAIHNSDDTFKQAALDLLGERKEPWATELLIEAASDESLALEVRSNAIAQLGTRPALRVTNALLALISRKEDPSRLAAIAAAALDDTRVNKRLSEILRDNSESPAARLAAAKRLMERTPDETLAIVRGER